MSANLNPREKMLAMIVGGIALVVVNLFVIGFFVKNHRRLRDEAETKKAQIENMQELFADKEVWTQREAWLKQHQPPLKIDESAAGGALLEEIREIAKKTNVQPLEPQIQPITRQPRYVSVSVNIETKSTAAALRDFLYEMQAPERFVVFEKANLQFDKDDKTQMRATFRIAKWYAPK